MDELLKILAAGGDVTIIAIAGVLLSHDRKIIELKSQFKSILERLNHTKT